MMHAVFRKCLTPCRYTSGLQQKGIIPRLFSSSIDFNKIAETIVNSYHPSDTKVCLKTLKTLGSSLSKEAANSALLSVSFRSKNERKMFFTWLQNVISNVKEIPAFPTVKKLTSRKKKAFNLLDSCRSYIMVRGKDERPIDIDEIESFILDIADNIPERLVLDVSAMLRKYTFELQEGLSDSKAELTKVFLNELVDLSSIYFDIMLSLMMSLDIIDNKGREFAKFRTKATKFKKQRINDTTSFSVYLERLVANVEAWEQAKADALLLSSKMKNKTLSPSAISSDDDDDDDDDDEDDEKDDFGQNSAEDVSSTDSHTIGRVKNVKSHQWGWSLHCLNVSVLNKELSPLDKWLLEEEKRLLPVDGVSDSNASFPLAPFIPSTTETDNDRDYTSALLTPGDYNHGDGYHTSSDFDEPYRFQDVYTLVADTRDQNSLEDIAADRDMAEKLRFASSENKVLIDSLPPLITNEELNNAFNRAGGGVSFLQIFHPDRFEASQPCQHATILNKKIKKKTQMKQIIHSDTYAYVAFDSKETFDTLTKGDMRLFGMCIKDGYRSYIRPAQNFDTFYLETLTRKPAKYWLDIVSSILGHDHEMSYGSAYRSETPAFIQFKFNNHENAWKAFLLLELALIDGVHHYQLNWRKCTWYYNVQKRSRAKRRNNLAYLTKIADLIKPPENNHLGEIGDSSS